MMGIEKYESPYCYIKKGEYVEWLQLSEEEKEILYQSIRDNLTPIKTINTRHSSYRLKHIFESKLGFYISNADLKKAMTECGYKHKSYGINWCFNVSIRSVRKL